MSRIRRERPQLIGIQEAADLYGVHYRTIRRWIAEGRIDAIRVGPRLLKVSVGDVDSLMQPVGGNA
jgi:excisionase family DNA binding protein